MRSREKTRRLFDDRFKWWIHNTGLGHWSIDVNYYNSFKKIREHANAAAFTSSKWKYMTAVISVSYEACRPLDIEQIEVIVVHEIQHIILGEMRTPGIDHEERVATMLQKAFMWVRDNSK